ncbi:MAG: PKD domain-containing protein [Bacteroidia bacterium]
MKKTIVCLFIVLGLFNKIFAQWSSVNIGTTQDLYSIDYFSSNDIWIGSFNQIIKTTNGGTNWSIVNPIKDPTNVQILPANMNDLALTSANTAIGVGLFFMGNNECILTTSNAGANWTIATNNNTVPLLRYINTVDVFSNRAVAAGNNGRLAISSNSGASWTFVNSGTIKMINDVKFISIDTVIAAGEGVILKSLNGGSTWTAITTYTTSYKSVSCKNNVVYIGSEYDNTILKSTDYGVTYTSMPLPFTSKGIICAIGKDTLMCAASDGLYVSKTGGQYWEKYNLTGYKPIKMIDFLTPNELFAVGDQGYVIKTSNLSLAPTLPICSFSVQANATLCLNDSITLINHCAPLAGYTYQWKHNNVTFSNQYNSGIRLNTAGSHTISLSVSNAYGTTTQSVQVYVTGHELNPFTVISSTDTLCNGNVIALAIPNSQNGVTYKFRYGYYNQLPSKIGDGSTLEFVSGYANLGTFTMNIKASLTNACYTDSIIQSKVFVNSSNSLSVTPLTPSNNYCNNNGNPPGITNVTFNTLNNTSPVLFNNYFDYSCCKGTTVKVGNSYTINITTAAASGEDVSVWIDYNNDGQFTNATELAYTGFANPTAIGTITISNTMYMNQKLHMRVASGANGTTMTSGNNGFGCGQVEDYYIIITPGLFLPTANFTSSQTNGCTTVVSFTNTSYNAASYSWNFGDGSSTVTTQNASHSYSLSGTYIASLTACNITGCHTATQSITVIIPQVPIPATCMPIMFGGYVNPAYLKIDSVQNPNTTYWVGNNAYNNTCSNPLYVRESKKYYLYVSAGGFNTTGSFISWIDYNNDGDFTTNEMMSGGTLYMGSNYFIPFLVPSNAVKNTPLRMRAIIYDDTYNSMLGNGMCSASGYRGYLYDYTVFIKPALPAIADFTASLNTVCAPSNQYISFTNTSQNAGSCLWDFGDGTSSTDYDGFHNYTSSGIYNVKLKVTNSLYSDSITKLSYITVNQGLPTPSLTINGTVLSTTATAPGYQWYKNGTIIPGATSSSYTLTQDGDYTLHLINSNGCNSASANYAYYPTHINFTLNPDTVCAGEYTVLYRSGANGTNFDLTWGDGAAWHNWNGLAGPMHTYSVAGTYTVKLKGCGPYNCDSITKTIFVKPGQDTATIVVNAGVFSTTTTANYYQWFESNSPIPGATSNTYTPTQDGYYNVQLSNNFGCSSLSPYNVYFPIRPVFMADTTGYCGVSNADVQFINTSSNSVNYFWDFGDGSNSTIQSPSHTYNAPGIYTVKLKACSATTCDSLIKTNYITVSSLPFTPVVTPSIIPVFCSGSAINFTLSCTSGAGYLYQWQSSGSDITGETNPTIAIIYEDVYGAKVTNNMGCVAQTNTVSVIGDYECVWPGDADLSYAVDNYDLLPIGLYYNQSGTARTFTSNIWQATPATNWGTTQGVLGADIKHVDCNGDGIINSDDTLAINQNYTLTHAKVNSTINHPVIQNVADISLSSGITNYSAGDWVDIDVNLGDALSPISNFYGAAFSFWYDASFAEPNTMKIIYPTSWINVGGANTISLTKTNEPSYTVFGALSKTNQLNTSGFGQVAKLHFQVNTQLTQPSAMYFSINDVYVIDSAGMSIPINYGSDLSINVNPLPTNLNQFDKENNVAVYPNPYYEKTQISYQLKNKSNVHIDVLNALGQKLKTILATEQVSGNYKLDFSAKENGLEAGMYFIKINLNDKTIIKKIIELE